jgi:ABC-type phosphate transport system permease subunit
MMIMEELLKDKPSNIMLSTGILLFIWDTFMLISFFMVMREPFGAAGGFGALIFGSVIITIIYLWVAGNNIGEKFNNKEDE